MELQDAEAAFDYHQAGLYEGCLQGRIGHLIDRNPWCNLDNCGGHANHR